MKKLLFITGFALVTLTAMAQDKYKVYAEGNYFFVENPDGTVNEGFSRDILIRTVSVGDDEYYFSNLNGWRENSPLRLDQMENGQGVAYTAQSFREFYTNETGKP